MSHVAVVVGVYGQLRVLLVALGLFLRKLRFGSMIFLLVLLLLSDFLILLVVLLRLARLRIDLIFSRIT